MEKNKKSKKEIKQLNETLNRVYTVIDQRDRKVDSLIHDRRLLNETALDRMVQKENDKMLASLRSILGM